jgi:hypothetical protein
MFTLTPLLPITLNPLSLAMTVLGVVEVVSVDPDSATPCVSPFSKVVSSNTTCFSSSKMEMAALISTRSAGSVGTGLVASSAVDSALACVAHGRFNIPAMVDAGIFTHPTKMENGESCCWAALPDMITFWSS